MILSMNNRILSWSIILPIIGTIIYLISDTLAPFFISFIIAYLLQPVINANCRKFRLPRSIVTAGVFSLFMSVFIIIMVLIVPIIYHQISAFISKVPIYKVNFNHAIAAGAEKISHVDPDLAHKISDYGQGFVNSTLTLFSSVANHIWHYTLVTINFITIGALVPVILYYFLRDWPKIVSSVESLLPMRSQSKAREIFQSINELLSAYIRGQLNICLLLSLYYVTGLSLIGLDLAVLQGVFTGFFIMIPFVGILLSILIAVTSCYFSYGAGSELIYVMILYTVGYMIDTYFLTPRIIGNRIGLHPVWIIFSVLASASLFGFVGVLFAIPIAGIVKVCLTHVIDYYKSSGIYIS